MTCKFCLEWAPQSREQLENRRKNMRDDLAVDPNCKPFHCPNCGGTDYMTCETKIVENPKIQWDWTIGFREWWNSGWNS